MDLPRQPERSSGYLAADTIAALATRPGGPVCVARVSGPAAHEILARLMRVARDRLPAAREATTATLHSSAGAPIDRSLVIRFDAPASYTGEDVAELHVHGGSYLVSRLMETLAAWGARPALPGEFSFRAVRNGKMSLSQAEAVVDLIGAANDDALALAIEKISGTQNRLIGSIGEELRSLAARAELGIDFSDQDVEELGLERLRAAVASSIEAIRRLRDSYSRGRLLQDGIPAAIVGAPNAGKSSLFNALLGEDRSIVSEVAGTTRDVVRERLTLGGLTFRFSDTAGVREARDPVERLGVERTTRAAAGAEVIVLAADPGHAAQALAEVRERVALSPDRTVVAITKCDRYPEDAIQELEGALAGFGLSRVLRTSAVTGEGVSELGAAMAALASGWVSRAPGEVLLTRQDHWAAAGEALAHLERARGADLPELLAADLRQALASLGPVIGSTLPDDILGKIFSEFCIGK